MKTAGIFLIIISNLLTTIMSAQTLDTVTQLSDEPTLIFGRIAPGMFNVFFSPGDSAEIEKNNFNFGSLNVRVKNNYGRTIYIDRVTANDPNLSFDLNKYNIAGYVIEVRNGRELINKTEIDREGLLRNEINLRIFDEAGNIVYKSSSANGSLNYDLSKFNHGKYYVHVYHGNLLVNKAEVYN